VGTRGGRCRLSIELARRAFLRGDRAGALIALDELLAEHPDDLAAHGLRGEVLTSLGREPDSAIRLTAHEAYLEALVEYERITQLAPDLAAGYLGLARSLIALDRLDSADHSYEQAVQLDPGLVEGHLERGLLHLHQELHAAAVGDFEAALRLGDKSAVAHAGLGDAWLGLDDNEAAIHHYSQALLADPSERTAYLGRAIAGVNLGNICHEERDFDTMQESYEQAVVDGQRAVELDADNPLSHAHLARALRAVGAYGQAVERFELASALARDDRALRATLRAEQGITVQRWGQLPGAAGQLVVALDCLTEALDSSEDLTQVAWIHESRGGILRELGRPDEALVAFDQAVAAVDIYGWAVIGKGGILLGLGRYEEATAVFERLRSVDLGRRIYQPWAEVGLLLARGNGNPPPPGQVALPSTPSVRGYLDRADIFEALGHDGLAERDRIAAVGLQPDWSAPLWALARSLLRQPVRSEQGSARAHRAVQYAERALASSRRRGWRLACLHVLGMAQLGVGRFDKAKETLREAVDAQPLDLRLRAALEQASSVGQELRRSGRVAPP
jgi:tetratricopeptide (TPR) repeat protein